VVKANPNFPPSTVHARHCSYRGHCSSERTVQSVFSVYPHALFSTQSLERFSLVCLIG
ncbi:hypothetical protein A2U01_0065525, partial [Trifolium medium]|nr:hypothetical protein [Trifolium medium]